MKFITKVLFLVYIFVPVYVLNSMTDMTSSHSMTQMSDCSHWAAKSAVCPVDFSTHLSIWQNILSYKMPSLENLSVVSLIISLVSVLAFAFVGYIFYLKRKRFKDFKLLYQYLFAKGILNGKAY